MFWKQNIYKSKNFYKLIFMFYISLYVFKSSIGQKKALDPLIKLTDKRLSWLRLRWNDFVKTDS